MHVSSPDRFICSSRCRLLTFLSCVRRRFCLLCPPLSPGFTNTLAAGVFYIGILPI
ncbi:hypothetical protein IC582_010989 [Cucumis melo]